MAETRLRIISDLHFSERGSRVRKLSALSPLIDGADHLLCNGDSIETRFLDLVPEMQERKFEFDAFVAAQDGRMSLITGNHDPQICARHFLELEEGRVLITHGDAIFPDICPWGWEAAFVRQAKEERLATVAAEAKRSWETHLRICKESVLAIRDLSPRFTGRSSHPWRRRLRIFVGVRRVFQILHAWRSAPEACAVMAETFRPAARAIIVGHTHYPGIWRRRGRLVINTGSAVPPLGALAVDITDRELILRPLKFRRGEVRVGAVLHRVDLDSLRSPPEHDVGDGSVVGFSHAARR